MYLRSKSGRNRILLALGAFLLAVSLVVAGCPAPAAEVIDPVQAKETTITILHIGDLHGQLDPFKPWRAEEYIGGMVRIATLINQIRAEQPNTILLDGGDTMHGTFIAGFTEGEAVIAVMNEIGYSAMVVGNHDFNYGLEVLQQRAEQADFPLLGANIRFEGGERVPFLPPYTIVEVGGLRIGIVGLVTTHIPITTHPKNVEGLEFLDPVTVAQEFVEHLDPKVDFIILLTHDLQRDYPAEQVIAQRMPEIVAMVSGCHTTRVEQIGNTLVVGSGAHGEVLGRMDIVVKDGTVIDISHEFLPITPDIKKDAAIDAMIGPYREIVDIAMAEVVGEAEVVLDRRGVGRQEMIIGNLVTDIMRQKTGADIALYNSTGLRASIHPGPVTFEDIFTVLPFDNFNLVLELTGETIVQALEHGVSRHPDFSGGFPQVSGMSFTFDPKRPVGERIVEVLIGGDPLEMDRTYTMATNCFVAAGGDGFAMFKESKVVLETGEFVRDQVAAYIREVGKVRAEIEGRIRFAGELAEVIGETEVTLDGERGVIGARETNLGNLVADVMSQKTGADIAIQHAGGVRTSILKGPITLGSLFTVLVDHYIVVLQLTGQTIWETLEHGVSAYPGWSVGFPQVSGMSFTFDPERPVGERIVEVLIGGEPLELDRTYTVVTNCFLAAGGADFTMLKDAKVVLETGDFLRDAVAAYIATHSPVAPQVEGRIVIQAAP
ncbi:MAG: Mannosylglucosyl-3-phosphoglycerate phosphatase [Dehalococcoidia bacterium]|nr:Mannosylglucosyl-3-phosphoglycerate phosphatase [Chloroflexota bacterium]